MSIELINPAGLVEPQAYTHVAVARGSRTVYVAGQVAQDVAGNVVGPGDLAAQTAQAFRNAGTALAAAGATFADVAKTTIYLADWSPEKMGSLMEGFGSVAAELGIERIGPTTLLGVASLAAPDLLIEVEVTAVVE
jgi:enamine deaminase RidA (YjgF/YER057c/UK114 family)